MDRTRAKHFKIGAAAALVQAGLSAANLVVVLGVLPMMGFRGAQDFTDPAKVLALAPALTALELFKVAWAISILAIVAALFGELRSTQAIVLALATVGGVVGSGLVFASGALGLSALWGTRSSAEAVVLNALINRLGLASIGATGLWIGLISGVALSRGRLPRQLSYLGLVLGSVSLVTFALPPLALLVLVLGGGWYLWLGLALLSSTRGDMVPDRRVRRSSQAL